VELRENWLAAQKQGSIINQQIIAGLKLNIEKARELRHRLRNFNHDSPINAGTNSFLQAAQLH
jgi:hypothetical protein